MRYHALACDYDGTIAHHGRVDEQTLEALARLRDTGRRLILVTGRELDDLLTAFPQIDLFDRVVAENGALLYYPAERKEQLLGEPPTEAFVRALQERGVKPLSVGRVIVATWEPNETAVLEVIRDLGLELQVIFNKGAVMVLPSGTNKATGLSAALNELGLSPHNAVGVGDAENDHAFLSVCECAVAVGNALPMLKERADWVTKGEDGAGVSSLIEQLIETDLAELDTRLLRHYVLLGTRDDGTELLLPPYGISLLIAGTSGSGKSTLALGFLERLAEHGYQFCIIDPEGDYESFSGAVVVGDSQHEPVLEELIELLAKHDQNVVVNLLGVALENRPAFFQQLMPRLHELRSSTGRPHWIVIDEAHHMLPPSWDSAGLTLPQAIEGVLMITVHPDHLAPAALAAVDTIIAIGASPQQALQAFTQAHGEQPPSNIVSSLEQGEALAWSRRSGKPFRFKIAPPQAEHRRHKRKYASGELSTDESFYFSGPHGTLHLRAQNLGLFMQIADGVDDATWQYHLQKGDYSRWFRAAIKDDDLADEAAAIERQHDLAPAASRARIREAIEQRYTMAA